MHNQPNSQIQNNIGHPTQENKLQVMTPISTNWLSPKLKPHRSAKNLYQLKNTSNSAYLEDLLPPLNLTSQKRQAWEQERHDLMTSLSLLKESAVALLAEKDSALENLKVQERPAMEPSPCPSDRRSPSVSLPVQESHLCRQLIEQREQYVRELEQKQYVIGCQQRELIRLKAYMEELEEGIATKDRRVRLLQQEVYLLTQQLESTTLALALKENQEQIQDQKQTQNAEGEGKTKLYETAESDNTNYSRIDKRLQELEQKHKQELKQVTQLFEDRIDSLREAYSRQLEKLEQSTELALQNHSSNEANGENERYKLSLLINRQNSVLQEIKEREREQDTDRTHLHSLKDDIRMGCNFSESSRLQSHQRMQHQDSESEFSCRYFEQPESRFSFHKKQHQNEEIDVREMGKVEPFTCEPASTPPSGGGSMLLGACTFTAGVVSGWAINSLSKHVRRAMK